MFSTNQSSLQGSSSTRGRSRLLLVAVGVLFTSSNALARLGPPTLSKAFGAPAAPVGTPVLLSFTITNPNAVLGGALSNIAFSDTLPAGLVFVPLSFAVGACNVASSSLTTTTLTVTLNSLTGGEIGRAHV